MPDRDREPAPADQPGLPHQQYVEAVAHIDGGPSGRYAPDEWEADREGDHLVAHLYYRHTEPRTALDPYDRPVLSEPVVSATHWPEGVCVRWDSVSGWQYGPIEGPYIPGAVWLEPLPVPLLAAPAAILRLLPALLRGERDALPESAQQWTEPGLRRSLAEQLGLAETLARTEPTPARRPAMPAGAGQRPAPEEEQRLAATVAGHPMLGSVGALASLLARLPSDMPLALDHLVRADPDERDAVYTVTPRVTGLVCAIGTEDAHMTPGLELGMVYVPAGADPAAQAAVAVRRDLPPYGVYDRAEERIESGSLPDGLADVATVLRDAASLLSTAREWLEQHSPEAESLNVETARISQAAARVAQLARNITKGSI
ncbi:hypothetical protein [Streptomyces sp. NPDC058495]|uniref:hypothetical protein n=1 Tax=unclassified Streptomyces TaxID=2593676 RepID=UPI0036498D3C